VDLSLFLYPCYRSFGYSLCHLCSHFRWPTQGTMSPPTMLRTMGRIITMMPIRRHPLCLLLSKCWLCKHKCFRLCSRPWSTYMLNPKRHRRREIGLEIFSALSHQPFLMLWSQWMPSTVLARPACQCPTSDLLLSETYFS
jgi:hypothetical protein